MLAAKNIKYDLVNIDLNKKPDWFFDLNPYGEVPVLLHNGGCVYSSLCVSCAAQRAHSPRSPRLFALLNNTKVLKKWEQTRIWNKSPKSSRNFAQEYGITARVRAIGARTEENFQVIQEYVSSLRSLEMYFVEALHTIIYARGVNEFIIKCITKILVMTKKSVMITLKQK